MSSRSWGAGQSCLAEHLESVPLLVLTAAQVGSAVLPQWTPPAAEGVQQIQTFAPIGRSAPIPAKRIIREISA